MKEIIYLYLILGSYYAHRKTISKQMSDLEFLKEFLKLAVLYPKFIYDEFKATKNQNEVK